MEAAEAPPLGGEVSVDGRKVADVFDFHFGHEIKAPPWWADFRAPSPLPTSRSVELMIPSDQVSQWIADELRSRFTVRYERGATTPRSPLWSRWTSGEAEARRDRRRRGVRDDRRMVVAAELHDVRFEPGPIAGAFTTLIGYTDPYANCAPVAPSAAPRRSLHDVAPRLARARDARLL